MKKKTFMVIALLLAVFTVFTACSGKKTATPASSNNVQSNSTNASSTSQSVAVGNQWPSNDLTAVIPQPSIGEFKGTADGSSGNRTRFVVFMNWTAENAKTYADILKNDGWTASLDKTYNDGSYEFEAQKGDYSVTVNDNSIQISKPKD